MQRAYNETWTNLEGYRDPTAGSAIRNTVNPPRRSDCRTVGVNRPDLMVVTTIFNVLKNICTLHGLTIADITLRENSTRYEWGIADFGGKAK